MSCTCLYPVADVQMSIDTPHTHTARPPHITHSTPHTHTALNPAVAGLMEELVTQAAELRVNSPVTAFLTSKEVTSVNPEGVTIPGSAVRVAISMATVMLTVIVGLIV